MLMAEQRSLAVADDYFIRRDYSGDQACQKNPTEAEGLTFRTKGRRKTKPGLLTIGLVFAGLIIINLFIQAMVIQRDFDTRQLQSKIANLKREIVETRMEMAALESFDRIQAIAENKLGMKVADSADYQWIAAAPEIKNQAIRTYAKQIEPGVESNLWTKVNSWIGNIGSALAQNQ